MPLLKCCCAHARKTAPDNPRSFSQVVQIRAEWLRHSYFRHTAAGNFDFPLTGLTTVAPRPRSKEKRREVLRFVSFAPHNLPCREPFAERFSEGSSQTQEDFFSKAYCALPCPPRAKRALTQYRQAKLSSRNCLNISIVKADRQHRYRASHN